MLLFSSVFVSITCLPSNTPGAPTDSHALTLPSLCPLSIRILPPVKLTTLTHIFRPTGRSRLLATRSPL
uniref:Putative secreted protein n=1 Tax=Panstrongylus lignarius TaxID=156445 RepID=A0A224XUQ8_9HEMI